MFFLPYFILFSILISGIPAETQHLSDISKRRSGLGSWRFRDNQGLQLCLHLPYELQLHSRQFHSHLLGLQHHTSRQLSTTRLPLVSLQLSMDTRATTAVCMKQQQCCQGNSPLWRQNQFICEPEGHYRPYLHCHMLMLKSLAVFVVIHLYHPSCSHQQGSPFRDRAPHFWTGPICLVLV